MPVQLTIKAQGAELVRSGLQDLEANIPKVGRLQIYKMMLKIRGILRTPAPRPSYPIQWDSEKQRRFVLAMLGADDNLPYHRTDALPRAWEIENTGNGYQIYNSQDAAVYVYGDYSGSRQSRIHAGRQPVFQEVAEREIEDLPADIEQNISYYAREKGF